MNGSVDVTRREFEDVKHGLKDHEDKCEVRAEKNEKRFDGIEKQLTKIQTILYILGAIVVFVQPFVIAWLMGKIGG